MTTASPNLGTVLLIDSDGTRRAAVVKLLQRASFGTVAFSDAPEGVGTATDPRVQAILLGEDPSFPEEVAMTLEMLADATAGRALPVFVLSQKGEGAVQLLEAGAHDVLIWPAQSDQLPQKIRGILNLVGPRGDAGDGRAEMLDGLLALTQALHSSFDDKRILYTVVRRIAEFVSVDRASIVLVPELDENASAFVVAASDNESIDNLRISLDRYPEIMEVLRTRSVLTIRDAATHPVLEGVRDEMPKGALGALTLLPMVWEDEPLGVFFLRAPSSRGTLSAPEINLCQVVANATAVALRNARAVGRLRAESERKLSSMTRRARELEKSKEFLESLIDASVDAIIAADVSGSLLLFNHGAERIYGYDASNVIGQMNVEQLYPPGVAREVMRRLKSDEHGGAGRLEATRLEAIDSGGQRIPISLTAAVIYDEEHRPFGTVGIFTDLRERLRVEEKLALAQEKLAVTEKQALVAELAGATAHELNQPLTAVIAYAELMVRKVSKESPEGHAAAIIAAETQRMAEIVKKIGKITKYETKSYLGGQRIIDLDKSQGSERPTPEIKRPSSPVASGLVPPSSVVPSIVPPSGEDAS